MFGGKPTFIFPAELIPSATSTPMVRCQETAYQGGSSRWLVLSVVSRQCPKMHTRRYMMIIAMTCYDVMNVYLLNHCYCHYCCHKFSLKSLFMLSLHITILPISFHYGGPLSPVFAVI